MQYYVVLRSILRTKPHLRQNLTRCRNCRIYFITHPRNAGRKDLLCPFGCREAHHKQSSNQRSTAYYQSEEGKRKKKIQNDKRTQKKEMEAENGLPKSHSQTIASTTNQQEKNTQQRTDPAKKQQENPLSQEIGAVNNQPKHNTQPIASTTRKHEKATQETSSAKSEQGNTISQDTGAEKNVSQSHAQKSDAGTFQKENTACAATDADEATWQQVQALHLEKPQLVEHIRMVTSLCEGRWVSLDEILSMLTDVLRQHCMGRKKRIDYVIQNLNQKPP